MSLYLHPSQCITTPVPSFLGSRSSLLSSAAAPQSAFSLKAGSLNIITFLVSASSSLFALLSSEYSRNFAALLLLSRFWAGGLMISGQTSASYKISHIHCSTKCFRPQGFWQMLVPGHGTYQRQNCSIHAFCNPDLMRAIRCSEIMTFAHQDKCSWHFLPKYPSAPSIPLNYFYETTSLSLIRFLEGQKAVHCIRLKPARKRYHWLELSSFNVIKYLAQSTDAVSIGSHKSVWRKYTKLQEL